MRIQTHLYKVLPSAEPEFLYSRLASPREAKRITQACADAHVAGTRIEAWQNNRLVASVTSDIIDKPLEGEDHV